MAVEITAKAIIVITVLILNEATDTISDSTPKKIDSLTKNEGRNISNAYTTPKTRKAEMNHVVTKFLCTVINFSNGLLIITVRESPNIIIIQYKGSGDICIPVKKLLTELKISV